LSDPVADGVANVAASCRQLAENGNAVAVDHHDSRTQAPLFQQQRDVAVEQLEHDGFAVVLAIKLKDVDWTADGPHHVVVEL
jgi:predicted naringenin-chalcone synthase